MGRNIRLEQKNRIGKKRRGKKIDGNGRRGEGRICIIYNSIITQTPNVKHITPAQNTNTNTYL